MANVFYHVNTWQEGDPAGTIKSGSGNNLPNTKKIFQKRVNGRKCNYFLSFQEQDIRHLKINCWIVQSKHQKTRINFIKEDIKVLKSCIRISLDNGVQ